MSETAKSLAEKARALSPDERAELVDALLASLDESDQRLDKLWAQEALERLRAYRNGEIETEELETIRERYLKR